ncbi:protein of unknown function [Nitrosomonas sp. PY1]|uniref:DUF2868 domain-containing protein n=1 Tax=Nitrosomonas sp. PY1 TaxID=1803906 RepID=UPI001FC888BE|nr:DUF2868 domain-containing protein [Nitrosomonas sp. PY1]GKS68110.1 protein of unknown function [Nitrosomonas sp. PY1]
MKPLSFSDVVRIEQLRNIEATQREQLSYDSIKDMPAAPSREFHYVDFVHRLRDRANFLIRENKLQDTLQQPSQYFVYAQRICMFLALLLGGLAASQAVSESSILNIYWLLAVLLGFNFISLTLWSIGILMKIPGLSNGIIAQLVSWLPFRQHKEPTIASIASRAWWERYLTGRIGKWRISALTHKFWLVYLISGLVLLVLMMLAKQYNFTWGTTLLPDGSLPQITRLLGAPLEAIGLPVPQDEQIIVSRIGIEGQDTETRTAWASFLIGTLLLYGIVPRMLVLGLSLLMQRWYQNRFKLDLYLPYYITLRQQLMGSQMETAVIDADPYAKKSHIQQISDVRHSVQKSTLPRNIIAFGIELDASVSWPDGIHCRTNIIDQNSQDEVLSVIRKLKEPLLLGVAAHRLPDRGVQRLVKELVNNAAKKPWMILLKQNTSVPIASTRELAWFRLAEACGIPADQVISR